MLRVCLHNELIKLKRSGIFWLSTVGSVLTNLIFIGTALLLTVVDSELITGNAMESWTSWINFHFSGILPMLLPMYLVILCALAVNQERRNRTWKVLALLPVQPPMIYLSKLLIVTLVFALSHLIFVVLMVILPYVFQFSWISESAPFGRVLLLFGSTVLTSLGTISLVYLVSYFSKNFVLPLAVGILGFVLSQLLHDNGISAWYFPFALPIEAMDEIAATSTFPLTLSFISVGFFILLILLGMQQAKSRYPRS